MTTRHYVGADPGLDGAIAVVATWPRQVRPQLVACFDMPTHITKVGKTERPRYVLEDLDAIMAGITAYNPEAFAVEEVAGRGSQRGGSLLGYGVGLLHALATTYRLPLKRVRPDVWKGALRCPASKPGTVRRAQVLLDVPDGAFAGPKGGIRDGRAEAALLALYVAQKG